MKEWFEENRWLGTFLIVAGVSALIAIWFFFHAKGSFNDANDQFALAAAERNRLERLDPFPSEPNYRKMKVHLDNYSGALDKFKEQLKIHMLPAPALAPNEFQTHLRQAMLSVAEKARANKVKLPENFALGFEQFTTSLPEKDAAPVLGQELSQVELLMNILIEARIDGVSSLVRKEPGPGPATPATAAAAKKPAVPAGPKMIDRGIIDLSFSAGPSVARKVLDQVASSNQQVFVVRTLHVHNEKDKGPPREQAAAGGAATPAAGTAAATPAKAPNANLNFIVGNEHLDIAARVELVRFTF